MAVLAILVRVSLVLVLLRLLLVLVCSGYFNNDAYTGNFYSQDRDDLPNL